MNEPQKLLVIQNWGHIFAECAPMTTWPPLVLLLNTIEGKTCLEMGAVRLYQWKLPIKTDTYKLCETTESKFPAWVGNFSLFFLQSTFPCNIIYLVSFKTQQVIHLFKPQLHHRSRESKRQLNKAMPIFVIAGKVILSKDVDILLIWCPCMIQIVQKTKEIQFCQYVHNSSAIWLCWLRY